MNITIVQTFTDGFTTYQSGQELSVPSEVAQRWIADGKAQADTDGQQSWLSSTEVAAVRALVSGDWNSNQQTVIDAGGGLVVADDAGNLTGPGGAIASGSGASLPGTSAGDLMRSFRTHAKNRAWQGAYYWNEHVIVATDRDETFSAENAGAGTLENIITIYDLKGNFVSELRDAYTTTDPGGKFMSFGAPFVEADYLYMTVYNLNDGGSPLIGRALRYTLDPTTKAITRDMSFGTSGAVSLGSGTPEQVTKYGNEWFVCFYDNTYVARYNSSWVFQANYSLSQPYPAAGGAEAMYWDGTTVYINMHGPNFPGSVQSRELHQYTWTGSGFTYVATLTSPSYGSTQGFGPAPWGFVWADRVAGEVLFTPGLTENKLRPYAARVIQYDLYEPTLLNGWVNFDATHDRTAKVYYDRNSGRVWLEGMIKDGTTTIGTPLFNVPAYLRGKYSKNWAVVSNDLLGGVGIVGNNASSGTAGDVVIRFGNSTWLSLDGVSWLVDDAT